jgi:hypothetical protein
MTQDDSRAILSSVAKTSPGVGAYFILVGTSERLPTQTMGDVWPGTIHKSSMEIVWHIDRVFPCGCTSIRITVTLGYEYRLFVAVIT